MLLATLLTFGLALGPSNAFTEFTVSGHSSGGSMASQHFVAFSERVMGLGHFQAAPYGCSKSPNTNVCTTNPNELSVEFMVQYLRDSADSGLVANTSNLLSRPIFVQSGSRDSVVLPLVNEKAVQLYSTFSNNVIFDVGQGAQHAFLNDGFDGGCPVCNSCGTLRSPYVNDCDYDQPGAMFRHIYGSMAPRAQPNLDFIEEIDQSVYFPPNTSTEQIGMNDRAFVYVPSGCRPSAKDCRIHVVYHGCNSGVDTSVGTSIFTYAGFNGWAESNNILVLYPQAYRNNCWDWTGRVTPVQNEDYDTINSLQANTVNRMVESLRGEVARLVANKMY